MMIRLLVLQGVMGIMYESVVCCISLVKAYKLLADFASLHGW